MEADIIAEAKTISLTTLFSREFSRQPGNDPRAGFFPIPYPPRTRSVRLFLSTYWPLGIPSMMAF
jgi:hypothetical protein